MTGTQQRDLITRRWREVRAPEPTELQLHVSFVSYFQRMKFPDSVGEHSPNGEARDERTGAKLKAMGTLPGAADYTITRRAPWSLDCVPEVFKIEFKRKGGRQSEAQKAYQKAIVACGATYVVIDDMDAGIKFLERYKLVRKPQSSGGDN